MEHYPTVAARGQNRPVAKRGIHEDRKNVLKSIKDNDVKYVDLRFTDPRGKWQHVTFDTGIIDDDVFGRGA